MVPRAGSPLGEGVSRILRGNVTNMAKKGGVTELPFEKSRFPTPKTKMGNPQRSRQSGARRPGYRPTRVLHATVPSSSGPAHMLTAKFEPAARSWAQMPSGSGALKRILSEQPLSTSP